MPEKKTTERARRDRRQGKAASTQAGEYVREEFDHVRHGKHGARSTKQAIAIGLSKARRAGVDVKPPRRGQASERTRHKAERDLERGHHHPARGHSSSRRSRATSRALKREGHGSASHAAISRQSRSAAHRRHTAGHASSSRSHAGRRTGTHRRTTAHRSRRTAAR